MQTEDMAKLLPKDPDQIFTKNIYSRKGARGKQGARQGLVGVTLRKLITHSYTSSNTNNS